MELRRTRNCQQQLLPEELGAGCSSVFQLDRGSRYIETLYTPSRDLAILSRVEDQEPRLVVTVGLKGLSGFSGYRGDEVTFSEGYTTITAFCSSIGERRYEAHKPVTQLRFSMTQTWLDTYFGEGRFERLFDEHAIRIVSHRPISAHGMMAAHRLLKRPVSEEVENVFIHGQAFSILASELSPLYHEEQRNSARFSSNDMAIAQRARDILTEEFRNPPSVEELSRRVGVNQLRLKQLFHHFFNDTPYGLLLDVRMSKAYQMLESTHCHVAFAADFVGYTHANNFSAAFVKHFGVYPKHVAKKS